MKQGDSFWNMHLSVGVGLLFSICMRIRFEEYSVKKYLIAFNRFFLSLM